MKTVLFAFFSFLLASTYCFGTESYQKNGNTVNCNGYDPQGNYHPCPSNETKSFYERAKEQIKDVKRTTNGDKLVDDLNKTK